MDSAGSFIPKNPVQGGGKPKRKVRHIYIVTYLIYIFFGVTLLSAIGLWFYTQVLNSDLQSAQAELVAQSQQFDTRELERLEQLDGRLEQANRVFNSQVPVHTVFTALEEVLLNSVVVTGLSYQHEFNQVVVSFRTSFTNFNGALFQRQMIRNHPLFQSATIENISYAETADQETGLTTTNLTYDIVADLEPATIHDRSSQAMTDLLERQAASAASEALSDSGTTSAPAAGEAPVVGDASVTDETDPFNEGSNI